MRWTIISPREEVKSFLWGGGAGTSGGGTGPGAHNHPRRASRGRPISRLHELVGGSLGFPALCPVAAPTTLGVTLESLCHRPTRVRLAPADEGIRLAAGGTGVGLLVYGGEIGVAGHPRPELEVDLLQQLHVLLVVLPHRGPGSCVPLHAALPE